MNQTYPVYELIIQDDGSTDETIPILHSYQGNPVVKTFYNEKPLGVYANFSSAIVKATGDYIAVSDQDDIWKAEKIERLLNHIGHHTLIFHNSLVKDENEKPLDTLYHKTPVFTETYLLINPYISGHSCLFRKTLLPVIQKITAVEPRICYDALLANDF